MQLLLPPGVIREPRMTQCLSEHGRDTLGHEVRLSPTRSIFYGLCVGHTKATQDHTRPHRATQRPQLARCRVAPDMIRTPENNRPTV